MFLVSKDADNGKIVLFSDGEYALRSADNGYDVDYVPRPIIGNEINSYIGFYSRSFGYCEVDWGDGNVETIPLTKQKNSSDYRIIFRSLNVEHRKNPDSHPWWFYKEDGSEYIPVPNHRYTDGFVGSRAITLSFTCDIYRMDSDRIDFRGFPILDMPSLEYIKLGFVYNCIEDVPEDRIARSENITTLVLSEGGNKMKYIPESWGKLKNLTELNLGNTGTFFDDEASNIRKLPDMFPNLMTLHLGGCYVRTYPKEWLNFKHLRQLTVSSGGVPRSPDGYDPNTMIAMDEIDKINPTLIRFDHMGDWYVGADQTSWHDYMKGKGLENITYIGMNSNRPPFDNLPDYFFEMRALNSFYASRCFPTQEDSDNFVDMMYRGTTEWEYSTMSSVASDGKRNQFYSLPIVTYQAYSPGNSLRPSGIYQAPSGFVKGSSNGSPVTAMEKIYVLQNNYAQKWTVKPED